MTCFKVLIINYVQNAFRWRDGRQDTGYQKMLLATFYLPVHFDCYILKYPTGSEIKPHIDPVQKGRHFRLNIVLKNPLRGGVFYCKDPLFESKRIKWFRPDVSLHSVSKIEEGSRYLLSIGYILKDKS